MVTTLDSGAIHKIDDGGPILSQTEWRYYDLPLFRVGREEFAVATPAQAEAAATASIKECPISSSLIDAELILAHSCLPPQAIAIVRHLQEGCYTIQEEQALVEPVVHVDALATAAIARYGCARFLCAGYPTRAVGRTLHSFPVPVADFISQALGLTPEQAITIRLYRL